MEVNSKVASKGPVPTTKVQRTKDILVGTAQEMLRLADALTNNGRPYTEREKELLRLAQAGIVKEVFRDATVAFVLNEPIGRIMDDVAAGLEDLQ